MNNNITVKLQEYGNSILHFDWIILTTLSYLLLMVLYVVLMFFLFNKRKTIFGKIEIIVPTATFLAYVAFACFSFVKGSILALLISSIITAMLFSTALCGMLRLNKDLSDLLKGMVALNEKKTKIIKEIKGGIE